MVLRPDLNDNNGTLCRVHIGEEIHSGILGDLLVSLVLDRCYMYFEQYWPKP